MGSAGSSAASSAAGASNSDQISWTEWNDLIEALPHPGSKQKADGVRASKTFTPSVASGFERHVLNLMGLEVDAVEARRQLRRFGGREHADEVKRFEAVLLETSPKKDLPVLLVYIYTMQTFFFRDLNAALRADDDEILRIISPLTRSMMRLPRVTPKSFSGREVVIYRGFPLEEEEAGFYLEGLVFCWAGFSSCSKDYSTAEGFAGDQGTVFVIQSSVQIAKTCLTDIEDLSYFRGEREVLMSPYTSLVVRAVSSAGKCRRVDCEVLSPAEDISGVWECAEDGGVYFVTCVGQLVAWFGHARPGSGYSWAHVFFGSLSGSVLRGTFGDVPVACDRFIGAIEVDVDFSKMKMVRRETGGIFLGRTWQRRSACVCRGDYPQLSHRAVTRDAGIDGYWSDGSGAVFFLRQYGETLFWFAHASSWGWAHVAMGKSESTGTWLMVYHDIILSTRFRYTGKLRLTQRSQRRLEIERLKGPFAIDVLRRT